MKGIGCDKKAIIQIIANRTNAQRQQIKECYKTAYGRDLMADLKKELSGNLEDAVLALFYTPVEYDVEQLKKAMKGMGTDEGTLIEIIASRPNWLLKQIKEQYKIKYGKELEAVIKKETSGDLQRLLISLLQCNRSENTHVNQSDCEAKAKELFDAGEAKWGTDSEVFNKIFTLSSPMELVGISKAYHKLTGHTILEAINKEFSGHVKELLHSIVYAIISPSEYFATRVEKAIKGWGTNDNVLIRILVTRDEIDMPQIKQYYKQLYGRDMLEAIKGDCSGAYRDLLIELAGH
jgi:hypothetical protein